MSTERDKCLQKVGFAHHLQCLSLSQSINISTQLVESFFQDISEHSDKMNEQLRHHTANVLSQCIYLPEPTLKEETIPSQIGKVHIITGGDTGYGFELVKMLYNKGATVYLLGRDEDHFEDTRETVYADCPDLRGNIEFIQCDLANLRTVKSAATEFLRREERLDVLVNNAPVMRPPAGIESVQGYDLQMAHTLGQFILTKLLLPLIQKTATISNPGSVRVIWASSIAVDLESPKGGIEWDPETDAPKKMGRDYNYVQAKVGNVFLGMELARRFRDHGIVSRTFNPGNIQSELYNMTVMEDALTRNLLLYSTINGAYTALYAGWEDIEGDSYAAYVIPWGREGRCRPDLVDAVKMKEDGGTGGAVAFWDWCHNTTL
ncbi:NAD(P)-binding protein [Rhizodiscina lignyota]|uniref:NAD(P)-binding protein n=1 Tax=Rhizodiscina lignyota TaxID=1504668 RepID=A0A9P4M352_9PEZI|nr:NAD(P)-binding protein [Rhizodiscina lignyota]